MRVEGGGIPLGREAGRLKLIKHDSFFDGDSVWITLPCLNSSLSPSFLLTPSPFFPATSCQASFINGSSWRPFSGIQGLLPFRVLISPDASNTVKTLLETIAIQAGDRGSFQGPDGWIQVGPWGPRGPAGPSSRESPGRADSEAVRRRMGLCSHEGLRPMLSQPA